MDMVGNTKGVDIIIDNRMFSEFNYPNQTEK